MLLSIKFYTKLIGSVVFLIPKMNKYKALKKAGENIDFQVFEEVNKWSKNRVKDTKSEVVVYGKENIPRNGNALFVSNHLSNLDFAVLLSEIQLPVGFLAKIELKKIPLIRTWMEYINCLFMDRSDIKQQVKTITEGITLLKSGHNLIVFPEGTRSKTGKIGEFKAGSFKLATKAKVPIIPITITGTNEVVEGNNYKIVPRKIEMYIHEPIDVENMEKEDLGKLHKIVQDIVEKPFNN